jgi:soluble lytic murein transglycosylase-like protein
LTFFEMPRKNRIKKATVLRAACVVGALAVSVPAQAQIYSWRDANGKLVLSNKRQDAATHEVQTYDVPQATSVRATRFAAAARARSYDDLIEEHCRTHSVRPDLVRAVMQVESGFNPLARSPKGAIGLMQLMPATARQYGVVNPYNPAENVRGGVAYLRELLDRYDNKEELALAAYNAGPGAVDKHGQTVPPYRETRNYVAQINQISGPRVETRGDRIYKVTETIDGREVVRYTDKKPVSGTFVVVAKK